MGSIKVVDLSSSSLTKQEADIATTVGMALAGRRCSTSQSLPALLALAAIAARESKVSADDFIDKARGLFHAIVGQ